MDESNFNSDCQKPQSFSHYVNRLLEDMIPSLEIMFGRKLPKDKKEEIEKLLETLKSPSQEFAQKVDILKDSHTDSEIAQISEDFIREIIPEAGSVKSPLEYIRGRLFELKEPVVEYIKKSKYGDYIGYIRRIIDSAMGKGSAQVIAYVTEVDTADADVKTWGQAIAGSIGKTIKFLTRDRRRFSTKLAFRCIDEYGKMSGVYERLVAIIAGFVSIESDHIVKYLSFRRKSLSGNLSIIRNKGGSVITNGFDILIRNSIAHHSYVIDPTVRKVRFTDPISGKEAIVSYQVLFGKTRELSCLILALSQFMGLVDDALLSVLAKTASNS
jgi:hypothetical protein